MPLVRPLKECRRCNNLAFGFGKINFRLDFFTLNDGLLRVSAFAMKYCTYKCTCHQLLSVHSMHYDDYKWHYALAFPLRCKFNIRPPCIFCNTEKFVTTDFTSAHVPRSSLDIFCTDNTWHTKRASRAVKKRIVAPLELIAVMCSYFYRKPWTHCVTFGSLFCQTSIHVTKTKPVVANTFKQSV